MVSVASAEKRRLKICGRYAARTQIWGAVVTVWVVFVIAACGSTADEPSRIGLAATAEPAQEARADDAASQIPPPPSGAKGIAAMSESDLTTSYPALPQRSGPPPQTTGSVPHTQIDVDPVPEILNELLRRTFALPDVENRPTIVSRGYVNRCVNDIRRQPSQPLIQWRFHPHTVHRGRRLRSTQGPSDA